MKVYIAGPMRGYKDYNYPEFHKYAALLRSLGYTVINPAESFGGRQDLPIEVYLEHDLVLLSLCDVIVLLKGWEKSEGVRQEIEYAQKVGIPYRVVSAFIEKGPPEPDSILREAENLVEGPRGDNYGHPYDDYNTTVNMFNEWANKSKRGNWVPMLPSDASMFMVFVKLSREANKPKRDNLVDAAGYLSCRDKILKKENEE